LFQYHVPPTAGFVEGYGAEAQVVAQLVQHDATDPAPTTSASSRRMVSVPVAAMSAPWFISTGAVQFTSGTMVSGDH
jgi:hypothetical protein